MSTCICNISPEQAQQAHDRMPSDRFPVHMVLDHRCPEHGEKAQPAVWGRHRELELTVSLRQWAALHVQKEAK